MAQTARRHDQRGGPLTDETNSAQALEIAIKSLIDNLIVPMLVEEFLNLYGPASTAGHQKFKDSEQQSQPDSELNSTS
jgi:hypothetical protein